MVRGMPMEVAGSALVLGVAGVADAAAPGTIDAVGAGTEGNGHQLRHRGYSTRPWRDLPVRPALRPACVAGPHGKEGETARGARRAVREEGSRVELRSRPATH